RCRGRRSDALAPAVGAAPGARAGVRWLPVLMLSGTMGVALAGATYAGIQIDRAIENALRRRKVPAPRLVMALASGALSLGMDLLEDRGPTADSSSTDRRPETAGCRTCQRAQSTAIARAAQAP